MDTLLSEPMWKQILVLGPLGGVLLAAAWTDYKSRKVYNKLTYPAIIAGIVIHAITFGLSGLWAAVWGAGLTFIIGLFLIMPFGWMKAGDIKLLIAVAAFLGFYGMGAVFFYAVLFGGIFGIVRSFFNGYLWELMKRFGRLLRGYYRVLVYKVPYLSEKLEHDERSWIPFAISIFFAGIFLFLELKYEFMGPLTYTMRVFQSA